MAAVYILLGIILLFGVCVLLTWICTLFVDMNRVYNEDSPFFRWLLYAWTGFMIFIMGIKIETTGLEKLPKGRFLLVQNHRSNFDPILTWFILRDKNVSFISKKENFNVPFFGRMIHRCCFRAIDRENPKNALLTIIDCAELIKNDVVSVGVYPEGTRNKNSGEVDLLPFHNGVFKVAQKADVPIVVTTIDGTETIHKNFPGHLSHITFKVVEVIEPEAIKGIRTEMIGERVATDMKEGLKTA